MILSCVDVVPITCSRNLTFDPLKIKHQELCLGTRLSRASEGTIKRSSTFLADRRSRLRECFNRRHINYYPLCCIMTSFALSPVAVHTYPHKHTVHLDRGVFPFGLLPFGLLLFYMSVETNLVWACSVNKVSKSVTVHPSLLVWQR